MDSHHSMYVMNEYNRSVDVLDSRRYTNQNMVNTTRANHHRNRVEIVRWTNHYRYQYTFLCTILFFLTKFSIQIRRMVALMKEVYGTKEYSAHNDVDWEAAAEHCNYVLTPEQGANECGFYVLKVACTYDGVSFVEKIKNKDVSPFLSFFINHYQHFAFFVVFDTFVFLCH